MAAKTSAAATIAGIAGGQHGNVTRGQLLRAGLTRHQITARVANGTLIPKHRGVYRVGHAAPSVEADYMAAVLAGGAGGALCELAAAHLLGMVRGKPPPPEVLVRSDRRVKGVRTRRGRLHSSERIRWRNIPVTTPARTLVDLAERMTLEEIALAAHNAGVRHQLTPRQVKAVTARHPNAPGIAKLVPIVDGDAPAILSWMERRALRSILGAGLPRPDVNRRHGANYIDLRWPGRLTVELISYRYHRSRWAWEDDARRRRKARGRGELFRSYTYEDVLEEKAMIEEIGELLAPP
jgi:hypothetical protein